MVKLMAFEYNSLNGNGEVVQVSFLSRQVQKQKIHRKRNEKIMYRVSI